MTRLDGEAGTPSVDDHDFAPPADRPWDRCTRCGRGEAAHARVSSPYRPPGPAPTTFHAKVCGWPGVRCTCRDGAT